MQLSISDGSKVIDAKEETKAIHAFQSKLTGCLIYHSIIMILYYMFGGLGRVTIMIIFRLLITMYVM